MTRHSGPPHGGGALATCAHCAAIAVDITRAVLARKIPPIHKIGGRAIGPDNPGHYGRTHDYDCPACVNTPFTPSPRSETYWSS